MDGPWHIDITPWQAWSATAGATPTRQQSNANLGMGWLQKSSDAANSISWDVPLTAGTWTITLIYYASVGRALYNFKLDGTLVGTIDGYGAADNRNAVGQIAGITVATDGVYRMEVLATNTGGGGGYVMTLGNITLSRTY